MTEHPGLTGPAIPTPPADLDPDERRFVLPIDAIPARRYAYASGDENPVYFDDEAARQAGYRSAIAPPTYVAAMLDYAAGPPESELKADGVAQNVFPGIVGRESALMGGGQEIDFVEPIYLGDVVEVRRTVVNHYQRPSRRFGSLDFIVVESQVVNQDGVLVMHIVDTLVAVQ